MKTKQRLIPLISSGAMGILGVLHLLRLWWKLSLEGRKALAPGYPGAGKGFDQMVFDGIGLDREATIDFVRTARPDPVEFELWVKDNATRLSKASIDDLNAKIRGYNHGYTERQRIFKACGLTDETCSARDALTLNEFDDRASAHRSQILTEDDRTARNKAKKTAATSAAVPAAEEQSDTTVATSNQTVAANAADAQTETGDGSEATRATMAA